MSAFGVRVQRVMLGDDPLRTYRSTDGGYNLVAKFGKLQLFF
jgi:hypothetical protein